MTVTKWSEFLALGIRLDFDPDQPRDPAGMWSRENSPWPGDKPEAPEGPMRGRGKNKKASYTREQSQRMAQESSDLSFTPERLVELLGGQEKTALRNVYKETANFKLGQESGYELNKYGAGDAQETDRLRDYGLVRYSTSGLEPGATGSIRTGISLTSKGQEVLDLIGREESNKGWE